MCHEAILLITHFVGSVYAGEIQFVEGEPILGVLDQRVRE